MITNLAAYKFIHLSNLDELKANLKNACLSMGMKGTILLSEEGINFCLAGTDESVSQFETYLSSDPRFADVTFKTSQSDTHPYKRMLVKIKSQIIPLDVENINPENERASAISAQELKQWLDENKDIILLDTRNNYEIKFGTFKNAITFDMRHFRRFPEYIKQLPESTKDKPIVSFCTGGVRCEKAAPFLVNEGFKEVYQLEGGILKYFEECGSAHYEGDCYVFDHRIAVDPELNPANVAQCYRCSFPITPQNPPNHKAICLSCEENGSPDFLS